MFDELLPACVKFGMSIKEYWELTLGEINTYIEANVEKDKDSLARDYNLSTMIASFVNCAIGGHEIPNMFEVFPSLFTQEEVDNYYEKQALDDFKKLALTINAERATNE